MQEIEMQINRVYDTKIIGDEWAYSVHTDRYLITPDLKRSLRLPKLRLGKFQLNSIPSPLGSRVPRTQRTRFKLTW
jgi:hypothetical protein